MSITPSSSSHPRILVLGVGNPILSDDSVGFWVASDVEKEVKSVDVRTSSSTGLDVVELILDYDAVIIIDAIHTGGKVGEVRRLTLGDFPISHPVSSHDTGLVEAINAGRFLFGRRMPEKIIIYAVEVEEISTFSEKLSPRVKAAIPLALDLVKREIEKILVEYRPI